MSSVNIEKVSSSIAQIVELDKRIKQLEAEKAQAKIELCATACEIAQDTTAGDVARLALDVARW